MRKWLLLCIALAVLLAGWRPAAKEPEGLALVRVLGVDGPGPVSLTAVCGGGDQEKEQSRGACGGADFREALEKLLEEGRVNGYTCEPQYRGTSFIPCAVKVTARKDGADVLTETIHIW